MRSARAQRTGGLHRRAGRAQRESAHHAAVRASASCPISAGPPAPLPARPRALTHVPRTAPSSQPTRATRCSASSAGRLVSGPVSARATCVFRAALLHQHRPVIPCAQQLVQQGAAQVNPLTRNPTHRPQPPRRHDRYRPAVAVAADPARSLALARARWPASALPRLHLGPRPQVSSRGGAHAAAQVRNRLCHCDHAACLRPHAQLGSSCPPLPSPSSSLDCNLSFPSDPPPPTNSHTASASGA